MDKLIKLIIVLASLSVAITTQASRYMSPSEKAKREKTMPKGCRQVGFSYKYKQLMLYPEKAGRGLSMYFMYNKTDVPVRLYQTRGDEDAYFSHLINTIRPGQWAALSVDDKFMKFICTKAQSNHSYGRITDCQELLNVCEWDNVLFGVNNRGNYWAVTSSSRSGAMRRVNRTHGILLRP